MSCPGCVASTSRGAWNTSTQLKPSFSYASAISASPRVDVGSETRMLETLSIRGHGGVKQGGQSNKLSLSKGIDSEEELTPKFAVLWELCKSHGVDFNAGESLMRLVQAANALLVLHSKAADTSAGKKEPNLSGFFVPSCSPSSVLSSFQGSVSGGMSAADVVKQQRSSSNTGTSAQGAPKLSKLAIRKQPKCARDSSDDDLPSFLLSFIEEHVCAVESIAAKKLEESTWTHVPVRAQKRPTADKLINLCSPKFRDRCAEELQRVSDRTAERHRILTLCSSAANQGRLYTKELIDCLNQCTTWINTTKNGILEGYLLAAQNTRLGNSPAAVDLHYMDKDTAEKVISGCITILRQRKQLGRLDIITGRGTNSHNHRSNLKPFAKDLLDCLGIDYEEPPHNMGVLCVEIRG